MAIVAIAYSDEDVTKLTTIFGTVATRGFRALTPNKCKYLGHAKSKTKMLRHPSVRGGASERATKCHKGKGEA